jgi:hypothetical protein
VINSFLLNRGVITLFLLGAIIPVQSYAGFDNSFSPKLVVEEKNGSPSLEIFYDRFIPDTIRKKYKLPDGWYNQNNVMPQPTKLSNQKVSDKSDFKQTYVEPPVEAWRARKRENLRDILQRWSVRSGATLMWASPEAVVLKKDFSYVGNYQEAVAAIIKAEGAETVHSQYRSEGLEPVMMAPASVISTNTPPAPVKTQDVEQNTANTISKIFKSEDDNQKRPETRWFGLSGAPLLEVIKAWAENSNTKIIWQSEKNFALKETISQVGYFEDAVFRALNQYQNDTIRPVGELYNDPQSGQQVLVVKTSVQ